jgi:hypothetical protein
MTTRREALRIIGAVGVTCSFPFSANELYGQHVHPPMQPEPQDARPGEPFHPQFFSPAQFLVVSRLTDLIIPPTDTPGAVAAKVPEYIDLVVHSDPGLQATLRDGLVVLETQSKAKFSQSFLELTEAQQVELLSASEKQAAADGNRGFFPAMKGLTADGYYTSRIGLLQELGYNGDAVVTAFPVFTLPEH